MRIYGILILLLMLVSACKNTKEEADFILNEEYERLFAEMMDPATVEEMNIRYMEMLADKEMSQKEKKELAEQAIYYFRKAEKPANTFYYLFELLKSHEPDNRTGRLKEMIELIETNGNTDLANNMKYLYASKYPKDRDFIRSLGKEFKVKDFDFDSHLKSLENSAFQDMEKKGGVDRLSIRNFINNCEIFALVNPDDKRTPAYLDVSAQLAHKMQMYGKAIELYDWILEKHPDYEKASTAMFVKGFILDSELKRYDQAREVYTEFLEKYPESLLVRDVKTSLEFLGKSDEEILKALQERKKDSN
jgi:tetratricopeptide (TPR) repeat protein